MSEIITDNLDLYETYECEQERLKRLHRKLEYEEENENDEYGKENV